MTENESCVLCELPREVLVSITTRLSHRDVSAIARTCRFLDIVGSSNDVWAALYAKRWPAEIEQLEGGHSSGGGGTTSEEVLTHSYKAAWQCAYVMRLRVARQALAKASLVIRSACSKSLADSIEVMDYQRAMSILLEAKDRVGFADVVEYLLSPRERVLINLLGVHYLLTQLQIEAHVLRGVLQSLGIGERQVCFRWWTMGGWTMGGFRRRDDMVMVDGVSLQDLASGSEVVQLPLKHLEQGVKNEVMRVQISADFESSAWVSRAYQSMR